MEPRSSGTLLLHPRDAVDLATAADTMQRYARRIALAERRLRPGTSADGRRRVDWEAPGAVIPLDFGDARSRAAYLGTVPTYLGVLDAATHAWPIGEHKTGTGTFTPSPLVDNMPAVFAESVVEANSPMAIAVVVPAGLVVTSEGPCHTRVPLTPTIANLGHNLGVYLGSLASAEPLPWEWCAKAMDNYREALSGALLMRAAHRCPCGRTDAEHIVRWTTVHACAAAATGEPARLPPRLAPADRACGPRVGYP